MLSGVPQGSVLGPILFLIYIDDVSKACSSKTTIRLFADDAKVYSEENNDLQCSLNNISSFFKQRQLELAKEKCETMIISKRNVTNSFNIGEHTLQEVCSVRDLGIVISNNLKWDKHIYLIRQKAYQRAHHILRSFNTNNIWTLLKAYNTYVRPILEYNSVVWSPYLVKDITLIESVQRFFTKRIFCRSRIPFESYQDRLYKLNIRSLEYRRMETDLTLTFKILNNLIDLPINKFFTLNSKPYNTRSHKKCLTLKKVDTEFQKNFFSYRVIPVWNKLPSIIAEANTLIQFRSKLKKFDLTTIAKFIF